MQSGIRNALIGTALALLGAGLAFGYSRGYPTNPGPIEKPAIEYAQERIPSLASYFSGFGNLDEPTEIYINEAKYILTNATYASPILEERIMEDTQDNKINQSEVGRIENLDEAQDGSNREEISQGTNILDPYNKLPPVAESIAILKNPLYPELAKNEELSQGFNLQNYSSAMYVLEKLQKYQNKNPLKIYSSQSLGRMLTFAESNSSLVDDYDGRMFHILTEFLTDNQDAAIYPVAIDQYSREIDDMIFDYCGREYDEYVRNTINLNWSNFLETERKGELINSINSGKINFLPRAIFLIDMENRNDPGDVNPRYNENYPENHPNLVEVAYKNIKYFQKRHDEAWYIATHLDEPLKVGPRAFDNESLHDNMYGQVLRSSWPKSIKQADNDIATLLTRGNDATKTWIKVYANAMFTNDGHDEDAVEGGIADLWTIGIPAYRVWAQYPPNKGPFHGELAGPLTQDDIKLLMSISDDELLIEPRTQSMTTLWTRKSNVIEDKTPNISIVMPNVDMYEFFRLKE
jgi:hypothetical protein